MVIFFLQVGLLSACPTKHQQKCRNGILNKKIIDAFGAVQHTVKFSAENFISSDKAPPVGLLKEAARLFRDGKVLNVQASDADMYRLPDRRNSGVPDGKRAA